MSYARWGPNSDVYLYGSVDGLECCSCSMIGRTYIAKTHAAMLEHLMEHSSSGHRVPTYAIDELTDEAELIALAASWVAS